MSCDELDDFIVIRNLHEQFKLFFSLIEMVRSTVKYTYKINKVNE